MTDATNTTTTYHLLETWRTFPHFDWGGDAAEEAEAADRYEREDAERVGWDAADEITDETLRGHGIEIIRVEHPCDATHTLDITDDHHEIIRDASIAAWNRTELWDAALYALRYGTVG